jgi:hypothetical protein
MHGESAPVSAPQLDCDELFGTQGSPEVVMRALFILLALLGVAGIALGVLTIAGIAVAAVKSYVDGQTNKLGRP